MPENTNRTYKDKPARRIFLCVWVSVAVLAVFAFFMPEMSPEISPAPVPQTRVCLSDFHQKTQAVGLDEISDYAPMFIPTRWNAAPERFDLPSPSGWKLKAEASESFAEELSDEKFLTPEKSGLERGRTGLLRSAMRNFFSSFGRAEKTVSNVSREGMFKLINLSDGSVVKYVPTDFAEAENAYSIAEFKVWIGSDGWISKPLRTQSSGDESNDSSLAARLNPRELLNGVSAGQYKAVFVP